MGEFDIQDGALKKYLGSGGDVVIPEGVRYLDECAFQGCTGLTSITIPDSVTYIGYAAFMGCSGLTSIAFPDSVKEIGIFACYGCTGLTSVTFPDSLTSIEDCAFKGCTGLTSVTFPDGLNVIGSSAFEDCTGLTSVAFPDSVTNIADSAFHGCRDLTSITIPDSVTKIGVCVFVYCTGLTSVTVRGIRFDRETLEKLEQKWGIRRWEVIVGLFNILDHWPSIGPAVRWTAFQLCPEDERNVAEIRKGFKRLLAFFIDRNDTEALREILGCSRFQDEIRRCMDGSIEYAIRHEKLESQLMLTNYKKEKFGFPDVEERFGL